MYVGIVQDLLTSHVLISIQKLHIMTETEPTFSVLSKEPLCKIPRSGHKMADPMTRLGWANIRPTLIKLHDIASRLFPFRMSEMQFSLLHGNKAMNGGGGNH